MKKIILYFLFSITFSSQAQEQRTDNPQAVPPPAGIGCPYYYVMDIDGDGYAQSNMAGLTNYIRYTMSHNNGHNLSGYSIQFYQTSSDRDNDTNPIVVPMVLRAHDTSFYIKMTYIGGGPQVNFVQNHYPCVTINFSSTTVDSDQDGIINLYEDLNNNHSLSDDNTDGDGIANFFDSDDDNDGILTINEDYNGNGSVLDDDMNGNGIVDYLDILARGTLTVNLKLFVEGYYAGSSMMRSVQFSQDGISPLTDVENITVELHNSTAPFELVTSTTAMLKTNGIAVCSFPSASVGSYYVVVQSSNGITTWSTNPQTLSNLALSYDFSTAANKAFGNNMKNLGSGVFGLYSGDINQDGSIDASDATDLTNDIENSVFGVTPTDLNGDGSVDASDLPMYDNNQTLSIFCNRP